MELKTDIEKISYAMAMNMAGSVMTLPLKLDNEIIITAVTELLRGGKPQIDPEEYRKLLMDLQRRLEEEVKTANESEGKRFLEDNAKKDGVKVTASGLQYEVLTEGTGKSPKATDTVKVHYEGRLINGQIFDSSIRRGQPAEFPLNHVIAGWTEGVQLMKEGAKFRFAIPSNLAYGERGAGEMIGPNSTLVFEVELLEVK